MVIVRANVGGILRDKMADKKVMMWAKEGCIMRDKMAEKKVIVWAKLGGRQEVHSVSKSLRDILGILKAYD